MADDLHAVDNRALSALIADEFFGRIEEGIFEDLEDYMSPEMSAFVERTGYASKIQEIGEDQFFWALSYSSLQIFKTLFAATLLSALEDGLEIEPAGTTE